MGKLDPKAKDKIKGPSWDNLRENFDLMCDQLLAVSPNARGILVTIYVKFTVDNGAMSPVYAVIWIKNSKELILGLALPDEVTSKKLGPAPPRTNYRGLTKYFTLEQGEDVPLELSEWAKEAYKCVHKRK